MAPPSTVSDAQSAGSSNLYRLPPPGASESELLAFRDRWFSYFSVYRNRHLQRMALSLNYYIGRQWLELDTEIISDGSRGYVFRPMHRSGDYEMPRPVSNYVAPAIDTELAALSKRELVPNVIPNSKDPRIISAAREAKRILLYRMEQIDWDAKRDEAIFLFICTGTAILKSFWDERWTDLTRVPVPDPKQCPHCGAKLSSRMVPPDMKQAATNMLGMEYAEEMEDGLKLNACPGCGTPGAIAPASLTEADLWANDILGRPLYVEVPKGNTDVEVVGPFELFPENGGVDITPANMKVWGQATPRSVDWIEERYPQLADNIFLENPSILMRLHPMLGEWNILGRYNVGLDSGVYDHHARVFEVHSAPTYRYSRGRSIVWIGNDVAEDGELVKTVNTGQYSLSVPKVKYAAARFKTRHREFWGQSLTDDLISPQNRINGVDSQVVEARERMGSPNLLVSEAMDLSGPEFFEEYGCGKIMRYVTDPVYPQGKPEVFGGVTMPAGAAEERDRCIADMVRIAGPQDIEIGEAPRNISTTSGLQLLGEAAERKRGPRERPLIDMFEETWSHQLQLIWTLRSEKDDYEFQDEDGGWQREQFNRMSILGQTRVKVEKQAYVDKSLIQREGSREALADQLYRLDSQYAIKKLLEYRGLPTDVNEDLNRQVELAERHWVDFTEEFKVPVIDPDLDDPAIHFQVLGTLILSERGQNILARLGWPVILKKIAGWEFNLQQAQAQDQQLLQLYGGYIPEEQANERYAEMVMQFQQAQGQYAAAAQAGQVDPSIPPPQEPPPPRFLPPALEDQIYAIWLQLIQQRGGLATEQPQMPMTPDMGMGMPQQQQDALLRFMSVVRAYKMMAQQRAQQAAMGAPQEPAPGQQPPAEGPPQ